MARKLSRIAMETGLLLAAFVWPATAPGQGERPARAAAQPLIVENPFARPGSTGPAANTAAGNSRPAAGAAAGAPADSGQRAGSMAPAPSGGVVTGPRLYRNPFAAPPTATAEQPVPVSPMIQAPLRPGSISRWQRSSPDADRPSPVKNAILATPPRASDGAGQLHPLGPVGQPWDRLPAGQGPGGAAPSGAMHDPPGSVSFAPPPNPAHFNVTPLDQPGWLVPDHDMARPLASARGAAQAASYDPFEAAGPDGTFGVDDEASYVVSDAGETGDSDVGAQSPGGQRLDEAHVFPPADGLAAGGPPERSAAAGDLPALRAAGYVDTPAGWYAEAERAAQTAQTVDELAAVAEFCHRGLDCEPPHELTATLSQLAAWAHNRRGELESDAGREQEAMESFQAAIGLDPECWLALHNRGVTLAQQQNLDAALADFNRVIELNPGLAIAYRNRAELLAGLGRMAEAVDDYGRALQHSPNDAGVLLGRGYALHRLGQHESALADLNEAIGLAAGDWPEAYTQRGNLLAEQGNFRGALSDFHQALQVDPTWAEGYRSLAWLLATCPDSRYRSGQQALAAAARAVELSPAVDCFTLDALAAAHASSGQFNEARRIQQEALAAAPAELAGPLRERLSLYERNQPYHAGLAAVRTASHERAADEAPSLRRNSPRGIPTIGPR